MAESSLRNAAAFMLVPFLDIACFTTTFALAIYGRKKPEYHRRLVLIAFVRADGGGVGAISRERFFQGSYFYVGVDLLILLGVVRDLDCEQAGSCCVQVCASGVCGCADVCDVYDRYESAVLVEDC